MKLNKVHVDLVEHNISPPMRVVVTIPTDHENVVIYVCVGGFLRATTQDEERAVVEVARALTLKEP